MAGLWTRYMESTPGTKSTIVSQIIQGKLLQFFDSNYNLHLPFWLSDHLVRFAD